VGLKKRIYDLRRKYLGTYEIDDVREKAEKNPYTFYLPSKLRINAIEVDDCVKVVIRSIPRSYEYEAERIWVDVTKINGDSFQGKLANVPFDIPQLGLEDLIVFKSWHIIDVQWKNPEKEKTIPVEPSKQVWDRCLVDQEVLDGTARIGYLYREEPSMGQDDDKYPDSGWRIRADSSELTQEQYDNPNPAYIALGKVLNQDDSWLHLINADIGSRYLRNQDTNEFEEVEE